MGDEKKTPPTSLDSTKPQYNLATNNRARTDENVFPGLEHYDHSKEIFESKEAGTTKTPKKKED